MFCISSENGCNNVGITDGVELGSCGIMYVQRFMKIGVNV
jgi:hypothetical protein